MGRAITHLAKNFLQITRSPCSWELSGQSKLSWFHMLSLKCGTTGLHSQGTQVAFSLAATELHHKVLEVKNKPNPTGLSQKNIGIKLTF